MTHGHFRGWLQFSFAELKKPTMYIFFRNLHLLSFPTIYNLACFPLKWCACEFFPRGHPRRSGVTLTSFTRSVWRIVRRICIFTSGLKGLKTLPHHSYWRAFYIPKIFFSNTYLLRICIKVLMPWVSCYRLLQINGSFLCWFMFFL